MPGAREGGEGIVGGHRAGGPQIRFGALNMVPALVFAAAEARMGGSS